MRIADLKAHISELKKLIFTPSKNEGLLPSVDIEADRILDGSDYIDVSVSQSEEQDAIESEANQILMGSY